MARKTRSQLKRYLDANENDAKTVERNQVKKAIFVDTKKTATVKSPAPTLTPASDKEIPVDPEDIGSDKTPAIALDLSPPDSSSLKDGSQSREAAATATNDSSRLQIQMKGDTKEEEKNTTKPEALPARQQQQQNGHNFKCLYCQKTFTRKDLFIKHMRIHTGERPFKCNECQMNFKQAQHLKEHRMKHSGDRPYGCKFCAKTFRKKGGLKDHERIHTGEKPFSCSNCDYKCTQKQNLHKHQKICQ